MGYAVGRLVREVLLDVRHPAWTPVNPAGETPVLNGTATLAPNDWQPLATGRVGRSVGASRERGRLPARQRADGDALAGAAERPD